MSLGRQPVVLLVRMRLSKVWDVNKVNVLLFSNRRGPERGYIRRGYAHGRSYPSHQDRGSGLLGGEPGMACQCAVMVMPPYDSQ
jgi:hypothetical protein